MQGIGVPIVTPFAVDESVDHSRLATFTQTLEDNGLDFFVACGSTGEAPLLTTEERAAIIETVCGATAKPVIAGTGHDGYQETIRTTEAAAQAGADAALVLTPHYYELSEDEMVDYYLDIAAASPIPIYLYSVPTYTNIALSPTTIAQLAGHDNIVGIKDSSGNLTRLQRTINATTGDNFDVLTGSGSVCGLGFAVGATGGILALANVVPEWCAAIHQYVVDEAMQEAIALNQQFVELNVAITASHGVRGVKAALAARAVDIGQPRSPFKPLEDGERTALEALLEQTLHEVDGTVQMANHSV